MGHLKRIPQRQGPRKGTPPWNRAAAEAIPISIRLKELGSSDVYRGLGSGFIEVQRSGFIGV